MKIGIISDFNTSTVNYGNHLQAYALNYYLRNTFQVECVESVELGTKHLKRRTNIFSVPFAIRLVDFILRRMGLKKAKISIDSQLVSERLACFEDFRKKHIPYCAQIMNGTDFFDSDYDMWIVGSDVVWMQSSVEVSRTRFLDFTAQKPFKRISYAPSFGRDYIPKGNIKYVRKYLSKFDAISVREHSSVHMLNEIGVENVSYCLDPTLLLEASEWETLEERPEKLVQDEKFAFVYLLGRDVQQRRDVIRYAKENQLKLVTVPHAGGLYVAEDESFDGIKVSACSVGNWLWLLHHAELVITDSFHGVVFSTIFQKRFILLKRQCDVDLNNRMQDYLREIGQLDKSLSADELAKIKDLEWNYDQINKEIEVRRQASIAFLNKALGEDNA